jgi:hypothetical protein
MVAAKYDSVPLPRRCKVNGSIACWSNPYGAGYLGLRVSRILLRRRTIECMCSLTTAFCRFISTVKWENLRERYIYKNCQAIMVTCLAVKPLPH